MLRMTGVWQTVVLGCMGLALVWGGNLLGWWYITCIVGLLMGLVLRKGSEASFATVIAALGGWALPLVWWSLHIHISHTAAMVSQIMGFGPYGFLVILVSLVLGLLLGLAGLWVARSVLGIATIRVSTRPRHQASEFHQL